MGNIDDFRAKQQELLNTQQQLRDTQAELDDKTNQLENARLKNEDEKFELIEQLLSEIDALKENAKNYEQQITSINGELNVLREKFNTINTNTNRNQDNGELISNNLSSTAEQPASTAEQPASATSEQPASTNEQPASTNEEPASTNEEPASTNEQTASTNEQTASTNEQTASTAEQPISTTSEQQDIVLDSYEGYDKVLSQLIFEIEGCASTAKYKRGLNKSGKETLKTAKAKLEQYKDIISDKKRMLEHEFKVKNKLNAKNPDKVPLTVSISASEINGLKKRRSDRRKIIEEDIKAGQRGESSNIAPWPNQSIEQVKKGNKVDRRHIEYDSKLNEALQDAAFLRTIDNNQDRAREFLQAIANNSLSDAQITICKIRKVQLEPYFEKYGLTDQVNRCIQTRGGRIEMRQGNSRASADYRNLDRGEAFQQGGLAGIVDKALSNCNNLTPGQRNTWKSIAVLGGYAAGIYGLFKFFTNKNMGFRSKAGITAAAIFGSQALTGESPIALFNKLLTGGFSKDELQSKFGNAFGDAVDGVQNSSIEGAENISGAMYSLMVFNKNTKVGEVRTLSTRFKNNPQEWTLFRGQAIENLGAKNFERFATTFSEDFDESKWNNWLSSIGIHDGIDDNKLVYELATIKTMNAIVINKFLSDNGVKITDNKTKKEEYEQYIKSCNDNNQAIDISMFEGHKDRFTQDVEATFTDREIDKQNRSTLENQVEALSLDDQKKSELKTAIVRFYDERTIETKPILSDFSLKMDGNFLILTSHEGQETKIDINNGELDGFGNGIRFSNLSELLNVADLSNKILKTQKGKTPKDLPPFEYKIGKKGRGIYFNDADFLSLNFDTRVLSGGWGGKIGEINTLSNHSEDYADYLSKRWIEKNKINVDSTLYPTVTKLSETGINFFNEQEVKDLEVWLKSIKENLKFAVSTPNGEPFSITLTNKLEFKAVNGDTQNFPENISEKFPTLLQTGNKEKFLKIMNDPNNKMRGSVHN